MNYSDVLNKRQLEAVTTSSIHTRVVAGAGAGKTRVLTYRIAFLLSEMKVDPNSIVAFTFTNKAADVMKQRISKLVPFAVHDLTIKTFHSFAALFLRHEIDVLGFPHSFSILDEEDQTKLIKDIASQMGYKRNDQIIKKALNYISTQKMHERLPDDITNKKDFFVGESDCLEIYRRYEDAKQAQKSLDFDDLLLYTNKILQDFPSVRLKWQNRIDFILVDEFQDTNNVEFKMIKFLMKPSTSLYVVGDPDQNIYTWRGANQKIILELEKTYHDIETIILDRNYRSTQTILNSANTLISHNKMRIKKNLYTENNPGEKIITKSCSSTRGEADYVVREIKNLVEENNYRYSDIAILYRANYVTLEFEQLFTANKIPFKIFGGMKFYQRAEIKDVLAYFNLIANTKNDVAFERICNVPRRGIGDTTIAQIKREASLNNQSMYEYIRDVDSHNTGIKSKNLSSLQSMIYVIDKARSEIEKNEEAFSKILEDMLASFDYYNFLLKDDDKGDERVENVKALFADLRHYLTNSPNSSFEEYLQNIALISSQDEVIDGDFVSLMTVHTAKGLEFPIVFIVRVNEGVFPHNRSMMESGYAGVEEERRLFYVAMTRAKERLFLSFSTDYSYVAGGRLLPSCFLKESGNKVASHDEYNPYRGDSHPHFYSFTNSSPKSNKQSKQDLSPQTNGIDSWQIGDIVEHKTLGKGVVINLEGDNIIRVNFENHGEKSILGNHPFVSKGRKS